MTEQIVELSGSPYELGRQHGAALRSQVRAYAAERLALASQAGWIGRDVTREHVLAVAEECMTAHREFSPELFEELQGVADATDLSVAELIVAGGFTDFVDTLRASTGGEPESGANDDCTAFLVPASLMVEGGAALAQTWDMHEGSAEYLVLLRGRPRSAPDFLVMTTAGCLGMIGMNEAGVCVGINNLIAADGRVGVTWPFVVRAMLACETAAEALAVLRSAPLAGGHNYLVLDAAGNGANVEAMPTARHEKPLGDLPLAHTNHCLAPHTIAVEQERTPDSQADSEARLAEARRLLDRRQFSPDDLKAITADTNRICKVGKPPLYVGTCGAVVMLGARREMWAVAGRPSEAPYRMHGLAGTAA